MPGPPSAFLSAEKARSTRLESTRRSDWNCSGRDGTSAPIKFPVSFRCHAHIGRGAEESEMQPERPTKAEIHNVVREELVDRSTRTAPRTDSSAALDELHELLLEASRSYASGPASQRQAVCDAVIAVADFLDDQGFGSATREPLTRIVVALSDLGQNNRPDPLFCEKPRKGKPRRSSEEAIRQGQLAALADFWLLVHKEGAESETTKLARAARRISGDHFGKLDGTALQSARAYRRQSDGPVLLLRAYDHMKSALLKEASAAGEGSEAARHALNVLIDALNAVARERTP